MYALANSVLWVDGRFSSPHIEYANHHHDVGFEVAYRLIDADGGRKTSCAIGLDGNILLYKYAGKHENAGIRIRPAEALMDQLLTPEQQFTAPSTQKR